MVIWSDHALSQLGQIHRYIAETAPHYARHVSDTIADKSETLADFSARGRIVPEIGNPQIREIAVFSWRLIYQTDSSQTVIIAILHQRQSFTPPPANSD